MEKEANKIDAVSALVKKVANVISVLTEITAKGLDAGLINPTSLRKIS